MKNPIPHRGARAMRPAVMAVAVAAVIAGTAGSAAGQGNAAAAVKTHAAVKAHKARHVRKEPKFKHPKLKHGVLTIEGTDASDRASLAGGRAGRAASRRRR
jgi:hypothetical protein